MERHQVQATSILVIAAAATFAVYRLLAPRIQPGEPARAAQASAERREFTDAAQEYAAIQQAALQSGSEEQAEASLRATRFAYLNTAKDLHELDDVIGTGEPAVESALILQVGKDLVYFRDALSSAKSHVMAH